ncbi:MAG TPA: S41 family peptidase [Vicinamibacterales bacterium]|nr:S41 family peptidase [Vicinamibacterales bacterium]
MALAARHVHAGEPPAVVVAAQQPVPAWRRFFAQFQNVLVILLLAATAISAGLWTFERDAALPYEAIAIFTVVLLNATMGYVQESRAEAAVDALRGMSAADASVIRSGERKNIPAAEVVPAGFRQLGLGKVIGVPTPGAVIGTGSYTLLDGSTIRTPGTGVWTSTGQNMENYGVPPDVLIDNTPTDFVKGRDAQIEKAVEVLKQELAAGSKR